MLTCCRPLPKKRAAKYHQSPLRALFSRGSKHLSDSVRLRLEHRKTGDVTVTGYMQGHFVNRFSRKQFQRIRQNGPGFANSSNPACFGRGFQSTPASESLKKLSWLEFLDPLEGTLARIATFHLRGTFSKGKRDQTQSGHLVAFCAPNGPLGDRFG